MANWLNQPLHGRWLGNEQKLVAGTGVSSDNLAFRKERLSELLSSFTPITVSSSLRPNALIGKKTVVR